MSRRRHITRAFLVALPFLFMAACASQGPDNRMLDRAPIGHAQPLPTDEWNNLFQDGPVWFAGQPTREALHALPDQGVRTVINIRTDAEMESDAVSFDEMAEVMQRGMEYIRIPVTPDTLSNNDADRLAAVLSRRSEPVVIHCGSSNRVGGLWALYLYRHRGVPLDEALEFGRSAGLRTESMEMAVRRVVAESP